MEEVEVPLEDLQEKLHHHAEHFGGQSWVRFAALVSALLAALAAVAAMLSGHFANEAMLEQIKASDNWSYYQAKGIKSAITETRLEMTKDKMEDSGQKILMDKVATYKADQKEIEEKARELELESQKNLEIHQVIARAVTFFQVAIAVAAISVLVRRRVYFLASMSFGFIGLVFLLQGLWLVRGH